MNTAFDIEPVMKDINGVIVQHLKKTFDNINKQQEEMQKNMEYIYNMPFIKAILEENDRLRKRVFELEKNNIELVIREIEKSASANNMSPTEVNTTKKCVNCNNDDVSPSSIDKYDGEWCTGCATDDYSETTRINLESLTVDTSEEVYVENLEKATDNNSENEASNNEESDDEEEEEEVESDEEEEEEPENDEEEEEEEVESDEEEEEEPESDEEKEEEGNVEEIHDEESVEEVTDDENVEEVTDEEISDDEEEIEEKVNDDEESIKIIEESEEEEVSDDESDEEDEEVEEITIKNKKYYTTDSKNGTLYECLDDDDIGEEVGYIKNGKVFFS